MCVCTGACVLVCARACVRVCARARVLECVLACEIACVRACVSVCLSVCLSVFLCVCVCGHRCACVTRMGRGAGDAGRRKGVPQTGARGAHRTRRGRRIAGRGGAVRPPAGLASKCLDRAVASGESKTDEPHKVPTSGSRSSPDRKASEKRRRSRRSAAGNAAEAPQKRSRSAAEAQQKRRRSAAEALQKRCRSALTRRNPQKMQWRGTTGGAR